MYRRQIPIEEFIAQQVAVNPDFRPHERGLINRDGYLLKVRPCKCHQADICQGWFYYGDEIGERVADPLPPKD